MYEDLVLALQAIQGLPVAENEWATRPTGNHATVQLDFAAETDNGSDHHQDQAYQGSVDLYTQGQAWQVAAQVETALESVCEGAWHLNSVQYDSSVKMLHREYVFEIEVL